MRRFHTLGGPLLVLGSGMLVTLGVLLLVASLTQDRLGARLEALVHPSRSGVIRLAVATRREARNEGLVGRIEVPRIGLRAMVVEGVGQGALIRGVGHVPATAFPGEAGNTALAGHRDTYFRGLERVREGDLVRLTTPDGRFSYRVESILVVGPERGDLIESTPRPMLTLVTCYPFRWVGPAPSRFIVQARPVGPGFARPRGSRTIERNAASPRIAGSKKVALGSPEPSGGQDAESGAVAEPDPPSGSRATDRDQRLDARRGERSPRE